MSNVRRQIEVEAPPSVTEATWSHFIRWILSGHQRLTCDELSCVDAVRAGLISFESAPGGWTTVVFSLEVDGDDTISPQLLEQNMARDLVVFKDYVERGDNQVGKPSASERREMLAHEERDKHETLHSHIAGENETVAYTDHFPT